MNKFSVAITQMMAIIYLTILSPTIGLAHTHPDVDKDYKRPVPRFSEEQIKDRLDNLSTVMDIQYTSEVGRRIKEYTISYRPSGERLLGKVDLYFPLFEEEIARRNLPDVLKFVAVVESHLDPTAESKSGAAGLWQFITSTAEHKGLTIDKYMDERKDPVKSTQAALDYLTDLHDQFGDWTLAMAAYNCGPGGVRKAIRRSGSREYWKLRSHLPKETQKYVPRIIAAMYLMQYYHEHNLEPQQVSDDIKYAHIITDGRGHSFNKLSKALDVDYNVIKKMNTQFTTDHFPKNLGNLSLRIPMDKYEKYLEIYNVPAYLKLVEAREVLEQEATNQLIISERMISPLEPLQRIIFDRIRPKRNKKVYKTSFS